MTKKFKWKIQDLKNSKQLRKSANLILRNRIQSLVKYSSLYLSNNTVENLHDVRIALRRVRYSMELFMICYDEKIFLRFYNNIQKLQDLSGAVRDVDISIENLNFLSQEENLSTDISYIQKANQRKITLEESFQIKLKKFLKGKSFKDFYKQLN
jgi:CHAD domain-containing protein